MKITSCVVALSVALGSSSAFATVRYVDASSTNSVAPYTSWSTAANVIQDAVNAADAGDEILVTNGVYTTGSGGGVVVSNRVALTKPMTLRSVNGPDVTSIVGGFFMRCISLADGTTLQGFTLTNGLSAPSGTGGGFGGGAWCQSSNNVFISHCIFVGNSSSAGAGVYGGTVTDSKFIHNLAASYYGGQGGGAYGSYLVNCVFQNNFSDRDGGGAYKCVLINCLLTDNSAIVGGGVSYCRLLNCTVSRNLAQSGGGMSGSIASNSIVIGNIGGSIDREGPNYYNSYRPERACVLSYCCTAPMPTNGVGNVIGSPLFVDENANDFRLLAGSPAINTGNNAYALTATDLAGAPRISDGFIDMGAYEFQVGQPALTMSRANAAVKLTWPAWASDFQLQTATGVPLVSTEWSGVEVSPTLADGQYTVTLPSAGNSKVFRLYKP